MRNLSLSKKLMGVFSALLILVSIFGLYSMAAIYRIAKAQDDTADLGHVLDRVATIRTALSGMEAARLQLVIAASSSNGDSLISSSLQLLNENVAQFEHASTDDSVSQAEKGEYHQLSAQVQIWKQSLAALVSAIKDKDADAIHKFDFAALAAVSRDAMLSAKSFQQARIEQLTKVDFVNDSNVRQTKPVAFLMILAALLLTGLFVLVLRRNLLVVAGFAAKLVQAVQEVSGSAEQISSSSEAFAKGATDQAASLEETSASSEEINAMARKNSDSSRSASALVSKSEQQVAGATVELGEMLKAMHSINDSSQKISKVLKIIEDIAFQTNLLALNAAIEAARAGEAGLGFAVVSDEVRSLAQRCSKAAAETAMLIEESILNAATGKAKVDQLAESVRSLAVNSESVKQLTDQVRVASEEQTRGIEQITKALSTMERLTQDSAAGAEESAAAGVHLKAQSVMLHEIVGGLNVVVHGSR